MNTSKTCKGCQQEPPFGGFGYCLPCKIALCEEEMLTKPWEYKWEECNPLGWSHFIHSLGLLLLHCNKQDKDYRVGLTKLFGQKVTEHFQPQFTILMEFAAEEYKAYGFSPIDFAQARLEQKVRKTNPQVLDFWLTLCCCFDLSNYLHYLSKASKQQ